MEIDNLIRYIDFAHYAAQLVKEKASSLIQEAFESGELPTSSNVVDLEHAISYYDKTREVFSFIVQELSLEQKTSSESADRCSTVRYWFRDTLSSSFYDYFDHGIFTDATIEYELCHDEERELYRLSEKDIKPYGKFSRLACLFEHADCFCEVATEMATKLIKEEEESGESANGFNAQRLENDIHCYRELRDAFSFIERQLKEDGILTKESYDKCAEIERICHDSLSGIQYFNIDLFLLATDEYKRTFDKGRLFENGLSKHETKKNRGKIAIFFILGIVLLWLGSDYRWSQTAAYKGSCKYLIGTWNYEILEGCELQFNDDYTFTFRGPVFGSQLRLTSGINVFLIDDNADYDDKCLSLKDYKEKLNGDSFIVEGTYQVASKPLLAGVHSPFAIELKWNRIDGKYRIFCENPDGITEYSGFVFPRKNVLILDQDLDCRELWYVKDSDLSNYLKPKRTPGVPSL